MTNHWEAYHRHWALLGPPLRPPAEAVEAVGREAGCPGANVLLLGVTPELAGLGKTLRAVDSSPAMIAAVWPGDTETRHAAVGSWLDLPLDDASVDAVIGDGSLNSLGTEAERMGMMREVARVLRPGGRAAIRLFAAPEHRQDIAGITAEADAGRGGSFHAFKLRLAVALAGADPDCSVPVGRIRSTVEALHPDRAALARATGWKLEEIATINSYRNSDVIYSFATAARLVREAGSFFAEVRLAPSGSYHLADRCPILVMRRSRPNPA